MKHTVFKLGELFCGPGGMAVAAHNTEPVRNDQIDEEFSISHVWGVDKSEAAIKTFQRNLHGAKAFHMDAMNFIESELSTIPPIDALAFGFPCNSFSSVGERKGLECHTYGELYRAGIKVIEKQNPKWFVAENVSGINSQDSGRGFKKILQELADSGTGYNVVAHLYKFEEYGVPQSRHRYVIAGIRKDIADEDKVIFKVPAPTHGEGRRPFVSAAQALAKVKNTTDWGRAVTRQSDQVKWRLIFTPPGENAWKLDEIIKWDEQSLVAYLSKIPWYTEQIKPIGDIEAIRRKIEYARLHVQKARMSHIYRRLDADKPAYTLTGSGGGGTHVYHWAEPRALTNEERAALQTFPDDFIFHGSKEEIRKQIGMAVPTVGAKVIFAALLKSFAHVPYESIETDPDEVFTPTKDGSKCRAFRNPSPAETP